MQRATKAYQTYQDKGGKIAKLPDAQRDEWARTMPNVARDWAESLEKKGMPGKAYLSAYMDAMRGAGQSVSRDWDKE